MSLKNPLDNDLKEFRLLIKDFSPYIDESTYRKILPLERLKAGYGILKLHKVDKPVRLIISSRDSITSGFETYVQRLVQPKNVFIR